MPRFIAKQMTQEIPNSKHQTPNTKHQIPNSKHQSPNTKETPNPNPQTGASSLNVSAGYGTYLCGIS
jgi:hypothetical protein